MPQVALGLQVPVLRPPPAETQMTMTQKERTRGQLIKLHLSSFPVWEFGISKPRRAWPPSALKAGVAP